MKRFLWVMVMGLLTCNISFADSLRVVDGDTIELNDEKIRFGGIDAPETNFWGQKQACYLNEVEVFCGELSKEKLTVSTKP